MISLLGKYFINFGKITREWSLDYKAQEDQELYSDSQGKSSTNKKKIYQLYHDKWIVATCGIDMSVLFQSTAECNSIEQATKIRFFCRDNKSLADGDIIKLAAKERYRLSPSTS